MLTRLKCEAVVYRVEDLLEDALDALEAVMEDGDADAFNEKEWARIGEVSELIGTALRRLRP